MLLEKSTWHRFILSLKKMSHHKTQWVFRLQSTLYGTWVRMHIWTNISDFGIYHICTKYSNKSPCWCIVYCEFGPSLSATSVLCVCEQRMFWRLRSDSHEHWWSLPDNAIVSSTLESHAVAYTMWWTDMLIWATLFPLKFKSTDSLKSISCKMVICLNYLLNGQIERKLW